MSPLSGACSLTCRGVDEVVENQKNEEEDFVNFEFVGISLPWENHADLLVLGRDNEESPEDLHDENVNTFGKEFLPPRREPFSIHSVIPFKYLSFKHLKALNISTVVKVFSIVVYKSLLFLTSSSYFQRLIIQSQIKLIKKNCIEIQLSFGIRNNLKILRYEIPHIICFSWLITAAKWRKPQVMCVIHELTFKFHCFVVAI